MTIRRAVAADIPEMVRLRHLFLHEANANEVGQEGLASSIERYFHASMADGSFAAWLAEEDGEIVATSGVCFYRVAPNYSNPTGEVAYINNMFTLPEHRRRGLASALFAKLIDEARERECKVVTLNATADGRRVYEKFGFKATEHDMIRRLE